MLSTKAIVRAVCAFVSVSALGCASGDPERVGTKSEDIVLPSGFQNQVIATGFTNPTAMVIAPDGRIFVAQQGGQVRVVKNNALLANPFLTVTVDPVNERGLVGITLDPNFSSNGFLYIYYTTPSGGAHNRVSRFTAAGDVAAGGSEQILIDFPALSSAGNHNSGALHFGNDGKLYVAHGDNAEEANAQNLNMPFGKIHRFNSDGTIPTDNPFYGSSPGLSRGIWAYGLRNPFTFAVERVSGKIFANDVGGGGPEEINLITKGANYGHGGGPAPVAPVYSYPRDAGRCAITGGTFYTPSVVNFPNQYVSKYFFADYCGSKIWYMNQDGSGVTEFATASNNELNAPVDLDVGLDGSLYYLQRNNGAKIGRIYTAQPTCTTNAQCSDGNVCNGAETCVGGQCQAGATLVCNDNNDCTTNACNPTSGCNYPSNGLCCASAADCNDNSACTTDSCVNQRCSNVSNGTCNSCYKVRAQRTNNYLVLDGTGKVVPGGTQANAQVFEKEPSGAGFKFKGSTGSYMRLVGNDLTVDTTTANAAVFTEFDCSSAGLYPNGKGYASATGTAPNWKATSTDGPIQSFNGGNGGNCVAGDATSWERFYFETATCGGSNPGPVCGDGTCNGTETCSSCAADCGTCQGGTGCFTIRSQRTNNYLTLDGTNKVVPTAALAQATVFQKLTSGTGFKWKGAASGTFMRVVTDDLTVDTTEAAATVFTEYDCSSAGTYPNGKGYASATGTAPNWKATTAAGPIKSGNGGNGGSCVAGDATSWERFYVASATCPGTNPGPVCGDGTCNGSETCSTCAADCGPCGGTGSKLTLTHVSNSGGWTNVAGLTDGNLTATVSSPTTPNCITYTLGGTYTITSARLMEDNAGAWNTDTWKVQYDKGAGFVDAFAYANTPSAAPTWNNVDFPDQTGVTRVNVCVTKTGAPVELSEVEIYGTGSASTPVCGDFVCNGSETCTSCPWDCDTCASAQSGLDARPSNTACLAGAAGTAPPALLSNHPCVTSVANPPTFATGVIPYTIAEPFWSDTAVKSRLLALPNGSTFNVQSDGDFTLPNNAVTIKNFQWNGVFFETRFFVRYTNGEYGAYTYKWNDAQNQATLVDAVAGDSKTLAGGHVWSYPTRAQCFQCHTTAAGSSLGLETRQVNVNQTYPSTGRTSNQFDTFNAIGMLSGNLTSLPPFPAHTQNGAAIHQRAQAYLHVNCANCHRPGGGGNGTADYRYDIPFASKNVCNQQSFLPAFSGKDLIEPGSNEESVIWLRMSQRTADFMPPIASKLPDTAGAAFLATWIDGLVGCPTR